MKIKCQPNGTLKCVYTEAIDLNSLGELKISRESKVEPDADGKWWITYADSWLTGSPPIGPFPKRSQAIRSEILWLEYTL